MQTYSGVWCIGEMAKLLGVSRSGYYAYCRRHPSLREQAQKMLTEKIETAYIQSRGTYGSPRIHAQLREEGISCSRPRIARLMKKAGIAARMQRLFKRTTRIDVKKIPAPNILNQDFSAMAPNKKWAADVSYIRTLEGWLYLRDASIPVNVFNDY